MKLENGLRDNSKLKVAFLEKIRKRKILFSQIMNLIQKCLE